MARLTARQRKALPTSDYAVPGKAPGPGSYPIPDAAHARNALARAAQHAPPAVQATVRAAVRRRFPAIQQRSVRGSTPLTPREAGRGYRSLGVEPVGTHTRRTS
jgi:hypothetical protein